MLARNPAMAVRLRASIFAKRMSFSSSLACVACVFAAIAGLSIGAAASADAIPGPPLSPRDGAGAHCPLPASPGTQATGFAAGVMLVAIAARRRDRRSRA
jgi:hypothetical protein